jgi:hypothetical protein
VQAGYENREAGRSSGGKDGKTAAGSLIRDFKHILYKFGGD